MKRATRIFMVLFFALFQCVSPLAHAHIGGDHSGQHVHLHEVQFQLSNNVSLETSVSQAISMPQSKQRNIAPLVFNCPVSCGYYTSQPAQEPVEIKFQSSEQQPSPSFLLRKQYPQAPPAL